MARMVKYRNHTENQILTQKPIYSTKLVGVERYNLQEFSLYMVLPYLVIQYSGMKYIMSRISVLSSEVSFLDSAL